MTNVRVKGPLLFRTITGGWKTLTSLKDLCNALSLKWFLFTVLLPEDPHVGLPHELERQPTAQKQCVVTDRVST